MKIGITLGLALLFIGMAVLWRFGSSSPREGSVAVREQVTNSKMSSVPQTNAAATASTFESILCQRCEKDGVKLDVVSVWRVTPSIPPGFASEAEGGWQKIIGKLEDRYGFIPVYEKGQKGITNTPAHITQIGPYLYFGEDSREIGALQLLADGDIEQRSDALDVLGDDGPHAESVFLALQKQDPEARIRMEAAQKLQYCPSDRTINGLIQALGDEDEAVQSAARSSLVWIGNESVLRGLRVAANDKNETIAQMASSILEENLERH